MNKSLQIQANEEELIRKAKAAYMRAWRQKNRDKVLEYSRAYNKKWRRRNKDKVKEYNRRYWLKKAQEEQN